MNKMIIQTKISKYKVEKAIRKHCRNIYFTVNPKRGQLYVYFAQHIDEATVFAIAETLCMEVVSIKARAILRH